MPRVSVKEQLVDAALEVFYREGFHATGIERVLAEAGVSKMTLYRHFRSKDDLILAALRRRDEAFRQWLVGAVEKAADTPAARLLAVFDVLGLWFRGQAPRSSRFHGCMFINAAAEYRGVRDPIRAFAAEHKRQTTDYLESLAREAGTSAPRDLAEQLAILIDGATAIAHVCRTPEVAERAKDVARLLIDRALAEPPAETALAELGLPRDQT